MNRWVAPITQGLFFLGTLAIGVGILAVSLRLGDVDLHVPLYYGVASDNDILYEMFRATALHGWYFTDPNLGAPGGMDLHDFPQLDTLHFATIKVVARFIADPAVIFNLYYLAGYPTAILTSLIVLRQFGISPAIAAAASLLFAFLPYHFWRGTWHIFYSTYAMIPLGIMVALWIARGETLLVDRPVGRALRFRPTARGWAAGLIVVVISATGVYYAFFTGFFLVIAGIVAVLHRPRWPRILDCGSLCLLLVLSLVAQALPFLIDWREHGRNPMVANRTVGEAQALGFDLLFLFNPTIGHHIPRLRVLERLVQIDPADPSIRARLDRIPEHHLSTLGSAASLGYLALLVLVLGIGSRGVRRHPPLADLARLNIAGTMLGIAGGFGPLISAVALREIRAYNRISIFLAFLSLFALAILAERLVRPRLTTRRRRWVGLLMLASATMAGLYDQIPQVFAAGHRQDQARFASDRAFVQELERSLAPRALIFQLPFLEFPEVPPVHRLSAYSQLQPSFHSRTLRWSFGAIKGRAVSEQLQRIAALDPPALIAELRTRGFAGIVVHREGYTDSARSLEAILAQQLGRNPMVSPNANLAFFPLASADQRPTGVGSAIGRP